MEHKHKYVTRPTLAQGTSFRNASNLETDRSFSTKSVCL